MSAVTELDLLIAGREQIKKGYTNESYVGVQNGDEQSVDRAADLERLLQKNPDNYVVVCAIGGVEHALYKSTGRFITSYIRGLWSEVGGNDATQEWYYGNSEKDIEKTKDETVRLYALTLLRLNRTARRMGYDDVENINTSMSTEESLPIVLECYGKAIKQIRDANRRKAKVTA